VITYKLLDKYKEIAHFCTSREGGVSVGNYASFNLSPFSGDELSCFQGNQQILCDKLGIESGKLVIPFQTHGTEVREIDTAYLLLPANEQASWLSGVDAVFTKLPGVCVGVTTADCVPLLFFDPTRQVVAAAHAGWRGTCGRIAERTILALIETYQCNPADIRVAIGPSISPNVYEIGEEVAVSFANNGFEMAELIKQRGSSIYLDLWKANQQSLEKAGILAQHIEISGICTFTEHERFFSARRLGIKSGRMLSGIMLKD
jgi:YfiH family protein